MLVVTVGNSLTAGNGSTGGNTYPAQLAALRPADSVNNQGISGYTNENLISNAAATDALFVPGAQLIVWECTNSSYFGDSAATVYSTYVSYCQARQAAGWKVIVLTYLPRSNGGTPGTFAADRATVNTNIRTNFATFADHLADVGSDANIGQNGDETNLTYYDGSLVHLNNTGYGVIAAYVNAALMLAGSVNRGL